MAAGGPAPRLVGEDALARLKVAVGSALVGKDDVVELALTALVAGGHLLLEDVPGVGKTTLAAALARVVGGSFARVQFTADLLPGDIVGVSVLDPASARFVFRPGPVFANVVLADEINRTTPRTQSALFEAMEEGRVTIDGETRELPRPFMVIATQNPHDFHGTWPLPDSQLDRFLMRIGIGYPDRDSERAVLRREQARAELPEPVLQLDELDALRVAAARVRVAAPLEDWMLDVVRATREDPRVLQGVSTRGGQALYRAVRAHALVDGRGYATPEDLLAVAVPVLAHRLRPRSDGGPGGGGGARVVEALMAEHPLPR